MNRRDFLKLTSFLGTSLVGSVNINEADPYNLWKPIPPKRLEKVRTVCFLCENYCVLNVFKRKELIFSLIPEENNALCPKGIAYHNLVYNRDRIKTPLLRNGEKGSLKFSAISYEKAIEILKEKVANNGIYVDAYATGELEKYYLYQIATKINIYPGARIKAITGADYIYFDLERADLILNFGGDLLTELPLYDRSTYITKNAKKIINITPMVTNDTALGSIWLPAKIDDLGKIALDIKNALKNKNAKGDLKTVLALIEKAKKVCLVFPESLAETYEGAKSIGAIVELASALGIINKEGGIYFYKHNTGTIPFNLFEEKPKNYFIYNFDPFLLYPVKELKQVLANIPFVVYLGSEKSDIARYADLILPIPFYFEKNELYIKRVVEGFKYVDAPQAVNGGVESIEMRDKANIELLFQKIFNFKAPYGIKSIDEVARAIKPVLPSKEVVMTAIKNKIPYKQINPSIENIACEVRSGISLYLYNDAVLSLKTRGSKWAEEMGNSNPLLLNSRTAEKLKLKHGDKVILKSASGTVDSRVFIYEGIVDDVVALKRFKIKYNLNNYTLANKIRWVKDKEEREIWWKNEDKALEQFYNQKNFKNIATLNLESIEILKG
jgi:anaerobic selenocysteine-containing dehydrogenase